MSSLHYLSYEQQTFAEQHHGLFLKFLSDHQLSDEYYTILIERYLETVIKYCRDVHLQRYAFSTVLWMNLRSELYNDRRKAKRRPEIISVEPDYPILADEDEPFSDEFWRELEDNLSAKQSEVICLRDQGYSNREIAQVCGVSEKAIERRFSRIRKKIKKRRF
jgi:RNA polymerase sigma factor (sigma-70 family)